MIISRERGAAASVQLFFTAILCKRLWHKFETVAQKQRKRVVTETHNLFNNKIVLILLFEYSLSDKCLSGRAKARMPRRECYPKRVLCDRRLEPNSRMPFHNTNGLKFQFEFWARSLSRVYARSRRLERLKWQSIICLLKILELKSDNEWH